MQELMMQNPIEQNKNTKLRVHAKTSRHQPKPQQKKITKEITHICVYGLRHAEAAQPKGVNNNKQIK